MSEFDKEFNFIFQQLHIPDEYYQEVREIYYAGKRKVLQEMFKDVIGRAA